MRGFARFAAVVVALAALAAGAGAWFVRAWLDAPLEIGVEPLTVDVAPGQTLTAVAQGLQARGVLTHPRLFAAYGRYTGADARMRAGEYSLQPGTTPRTLLTLFVSGAVVQHSVTIVEGWTFRELRKALADVPALEPATREASDAEIMAQLGEEGRHPEGLFFPDTYLFGKGTRDIEILRQARDRMRKELDQAWAGRQENLPLRDDEDFYRSGVSMQYSGSLTGLHRFLQQVEEAKPQIKVERLSVTANAKDSRRVEGQIVLSAYAVVTGKGAKG